jgi:integrase
LSIYADKRNGKATGRFCVEVQRGRNTLRGRADDYTKAKALERGFIRQLETGSPAEAKTSRYLPGQTERMSDLITRAEQTLWFGKPSADDNFKKLRYVVEVIGDQPVDNISTKLIMDDLISKLRESGPKGRPLSDSTINRYLAAISKFLKWTIDRGYRQTPMPKIEWMDEDDGRIRWVTPDEERTLSSLLPDPYDTIVRVAIRTGMRRSEIYEVVEGTGANLTKDHIHMWKTKNRKARSIPISFETHADLLYLRDVGMPTERQLRYEWDKAKAAMGLADDDDFVFHACRHTFCTRLVQAEVDIRIIKDLAGHKTIQTTLRYAHVANSDLRKAVNKVAALFQQECHKT